MNPRKIIGATVRATNRTHGLAPSVSQGEEETVAMVVNEHSLTVRTVEGNVYLLGGYEVVRYPEGGER